MWKETSTFTKESAPLPSWKKLLVKQSKQMISMGKLSDTVKDFIRQVFSIYKR